MKYLESYEKSFASEGARAQIAYTLWALGWREIVGGVNGYPTSQQFNEVCGRIDRKANELKENKLDLDGDASRLTIDGISLVDYVADIGAKEVLFRMADVRENIKSGESMAVILGKIQRFFEDIKPYVFNGADDPFVLMRESTYIPPARRTKGSLYGLVTRSRGVIVVQYDRYVQGLEQPRQKRTLYGVETRSRATAVVAARPYIGVMRCMVTLEEGDTTAREPETLYGIIKRTQGG